MSFRPSLAQAYGQKSFRKSSDKASVQASAQAPNSDQLLRGAPRKCQRPSAYATTIFYAPPSTTRTIPPQAAILVQERISSGSSIVEALPQLPSQIPPQEKTPPFGQPASRLAPKRDHVIKARQVKQQESTAKENPKSARAPTQRGVQEPGHKFAGNEIDRPEKAPAHLTAGTIIGKPSRRYGQARRKTSSSPESDQRVSQLPVRVADRNPIGRPAGLAARRPIRRLVTFLVEILQGQ